MDQEYRISSGAKFLYGFYGTLTLVLSIYLFNDYNPTVTRAVQIIPVALIIISILFFVSLARGKIIISSDNIVCRRLFSRKELALNEIKGFRVGGKIIHIESTDVNKSIIRIVNYADYKDSGQLTQWLKDNCQDLDAIDLKDDQKTAMSNPGLGKNEVERIIALTRARKISYIYNVIGLTLGSIMIFFDPKFIVLLAIIYPLLGIPIMMFSGGTIKFLSKSERSIARHIELGMVLSCFFLLIVGLREYHILQTGHFWLPAFIISTLFFLLIYKTGLNHTMGQLWVQVFCMLLTSLLYGFGTTYQVNCEFDKSETKIFKATVVDHRISRGKSATYYLILSPWGPVKKEDETEVYRSLYSEVDIGDTVQVREKDGLMNIPWYIITK